MLPVVCLQGSMFLLAVARYGCNFLDSVVRLQVTTIPLRPNTHPSATRTVIPSYTISWSQPRHASSSTTSPLGNRHFTSQRSPTISYTSFHASIHLISMPSSSATEIPFRLQKSPTPAMRCNLPSLKSTPNSCSISQQPCQKIAESHRSSDGPNMSIELSGQMIYHARRSRIPHI